MKSLKFFPLFFLVLTVFVGMSPRPPVSHASGPYKTFLPTIQNVAAPTQALTGARINIPYFDGPEQANETAIFWFGRVYETENYTDVRIGYTSEFLYVRLANFDRQLWYDTSPALSDLTDWDSATLYLSMNGNTGGTLNANTYAFSGQLAWNEPNLEAAYQGSAGTWQPISIPFISAAGWKSDLSGINDDTKPDRGWALTYSVPFTSLGLTAPPSPNTIWGLAILLYDRDDAAGNIPIANKSWPPAMSPTKPDTWGQLSFGPSSFETAALSRPDLQPDGTTIIRQGENGAVVKDAMVGGSMSCGQGLSPAFSLWGEANYSGAHQINIQNQYNLDDWPCFSKYYVTFPLDSVPNSALVTSANLTLYHFSNAGNTSPDPVPTSLLQVMVVGQDWNEDTITWNNAPLAVENISQLWVPPTYGGVLVARTWDIGAAVAAAWEAGQPLRLVIYSADSGQHSGKYFISSDAGSSGALNRPTLTVNWANP
jgi:hypothetical protein